MVRRILRAPRVFNAQVAREVDAGSCEQSEAEGGGLLNADQPLGHLRFSSHILVLNHFLDRAAWLLLALDAAFWELAGTILGTVV
ncbi:MAG TPA: hypothetical protein VD833_16685 [Vicinamibacterales bacterium]|nr:hypothetical protein [Vicinamibacterales bacterium]